MGDGQFMLYTPNNKYSTIMLKREEEDTCSRAASEYLKFKTKSILCLQQSAHSWRDRSVLVNYSWHTQWTIQFLQDSINDNLKGEVPIADSCQVRKGICFY